MAMDKHFTILVIWLLCFPISCLSDSPPSDETQELQNEENCECQCEGYTFSYKKAGGAIVGAVVVVAGVPYALSAAGFTATGVAAGTVAAKAMALFGGAVPAGGLFATLQSMGAAGMGFLGSMAAGSFGGLSGYVFGDLFTETCDCTCPATKDEL